MVSMGVKKLLRAAVRKPLSRFSTSVDMRRQWGMPESNAIPTGHTTAIDQ